MFDGNRLKEIRMANGLTQKDTAKQFNISPSTLNRYENNDRTPSIDFLNEFSITFGVKLTWLANHPEATSVEDQIDDYGHQQDSPYNIACFQVLSKTEWSHLTEDQIDKLRAYAKFIMRKDT